MSSHCWVRRQAGTGGKNRSPTAETPAGRRLLAHSIRTMKRLVVPTIAVLLQSFVPLVAQEDDGFVPMFNGKDLSGWRPVNVAADTFRWENGMVVISGVPTGFMATERMYENFIVECDWQHMKEGGNSGIFIWGEGLPAPGVPYARGIEVQVLDLAYEKNKGAWEWFTSHGDIFPIWGADMTPVAPTAKSGKRSFPIEKRVKPSPEWNHYRVECVNGEIKLSVNGKHVTTGRDCIPRKGYICLESEGSETHFKNVRIKELPSSGATAEQTARGYEGFKQLFNGKDFTGWKVSDDIKSVWSVNGLHVNAKAEVKGRSLDLWSERSFKNFELVADWRLPAKAVSKPLPTFTVDGLYVLDDRGKIVLKEINHAGDSGIYLRGSARHQVNIWSQPMGSGDINELHKDKSIPAELRLAMLPKKRADAKFGAWNRFIITLKNDRVTVVLNDETVIEDAQLPGIPAEGPIALQYHHDAIEFANVFIKEL